MVRFQCLDKALSHAVAMRPVHLSVSQLLGKTFGLGRRVAAAGVGNLFNGLDPLAFRAKPVSYRLHY